MVLTEEEEYEKSKMLAFVDEYNNEFNTHAKNLIVGKMYATLIQCPSLLSKFPSLRNTVQNKVIEFEQMEFYGIIILEDLKFTLQTIKYIIANIHTRDDYIA
jgi:hypothetical protein